MVNISDRKTQLNPPQEAGFSLTEILIAGLVLVVAVGGLWASFATSKQASARSKVRLMAIHNGRYIMELLREDMRLDTWDTGNLSNGSHDVTAWLPTGPDTFRSKYDGTAVYNVTTEPQGYKKVELVLSWRDL
jgi:Tfp pilus assembly protein PilV